jgi:hypothetical protein
VLPPFYRDRKSERERGMMYGGENRHERRRKET